ncbi:MAG: HlyD family secretion protein [Panacagrimonas sp.]
MFVSPYRKFEPGEILELPGAGSVELSGMPGGRGACLSRTDFELAQLFDGQRNAVSVAAAAREHFGTSATPPVVEQFAADLSLAGLLRAGSREPLPVPAHSDVEAGLVGWSAADPNNPTLTGSAHPPSMLPGSRYGPGLTGSLTGLVTGRRGQANRIDWSLPPQVLSAFGSLLLWPLTHRAALLGFFALMAAAITAAITHRHEWMEHLARGYGGFRLVSGGIVAGYLINLFATAARVAAIAHYTPERPRVGIVFGFGPLRIPRLFVDTSGAAERADRLTRMRIVGAGLIGMGALFVAAVLVWFVTGQTESMVARNAVVTAIVALVFGLLRLNPLAPYDGYFLLCNALGNLDLRAEAIAALFGQRRPWQVQSHSVSKRALAWFAIAVMVFMVAVVVFIVVFPLSNLLERLNGVGFLIALAVTGVFMQKQYVRSAVKRSGMGWPDKGWKRYLPSRAWQIAIGIFLVVCVLPYPYEPSGNFEVLPRNRADVRALTAGDVLEVLAYENDVVTEGQPIVRLNNAAQLAKVASAEAELARHQAELSLLKLGARKEEIEVARQAVATARSASKVADAEARRITQAYKGKSVTPQEYDRALGAAEVAKQKLAEAESGLILVGSAARNEAVTALQAEIRKVEAELNYQRQELQYTTIKAPIAGRIVSARLQFARGNYLERGELLATIEDTGELLAEIKLPEAVIGGIEVEADAFAKPWAHPGSSFEGRVKRIAPAAEEGEYGKVVRVQMVVSDPDGVLKTGMTGSAKVEAGWSLTIIVFTKALVRFFLVEVWSWIP